MSKSSDGSLALTTRDRCRRRRRPAKARDAGLSSPTEQGEPSGSDNSENFLALYFREMAALSMLRPEEEVRAARHIEAIELDLWQHLLAAYPRLAEVVFTIIERTLDRRPEGLEGMRRSARALAGRSTVAARRRFAELCRAHVESIYEQDTDRRALLVVMAELRRAARGERGLIHARVRGRFSSRCKAFKDYSRAAWAKFSAAQRARNDFVNANLRLVVSIARRFNHGRMPLSDLIQEGNIGLIKAVDRYDYKRGYRFSTYASWWIRHAISRALADKGRAVRLPVHMLDAQQKVGRTGRELSTRLGRQPTAEELALATGLSEDKIERIQALMADQSVSLDRSVSEEDDRRFVELLVDESSPSPTDQLYEEKLAEQLHEVLRHLKPIEADVLRQRFGLHGGTELTLKEIGENYQLSRERIRQIQEQAMGKVRRALELRQVV